MIFDSHAHYDDDQFNEDREEEPGKIMRKRASLSGVQSWEIVW